MAQPYVFFGMNALGGRCYDWLKGRGDKPAYNIVQDSVSYAGGPMFDWLPTFGLSIGYRHIIKPPWLNHFTDGIVNLHTGYLPYNRGRFPNVWPILDGTPAGVTIHWMDEGIDTGDIIAQRKVEVQPWDTAETLYHKLEDAGYDLFVETWPAILDGTASRTKQPAGGSIHYAKELADLDWLWPRPKKSAGYDEIDQLRARTFNGYEGVRYRDGDHIIEAKIQLRKVG